MQGPKGAVSIIQQAGVSHFLDLAFCLLAHLFILYYHIILILISTLGEKWSNVVLTPGSINSTDDIFGLVLYVWAVCRFVLKHQLKFLWLDAVSILPWNTPLKLHTMQVAMLKLRHFRAFRAPRIVCLRTLRLCGSSLAPFICSPKQDMTQPDPTWHNMT